MRAIAVLAALIAASGCAAVRTTANAVSNTATFLDDELSTHPSDVAAPPPDTYDRPNVAYDRPAPNAAPPSYQPAPPAYHPPPPPQRGPAAQVEQGPRLHVARPGDTMDTIADQYGLRVTALERVNGLSPPYEVRPGDVILLPNAQPYEAGPPAPAQPIETAAPAPPPPTTPAPVAPPSPGNGFYARPVPGPIVARFGAQANGRRLDGVEMAAQAGAPIMAAADGEVVYAGGDLPAYDHLVLVRHADGGVTAYGYARRLNVREGQQVRRGQTIGEAGARGRVLFQVRRGATAIDPAPLLGD